MKLPIWTSANFLSRFWEKVDKRGADECWPWTASGVRGRGRISISGRMYIAPQVAKVLSDRAWPAPRLMACHECDNPACCNPAHIWWGTNRENMKDAVAKGRPVGAAKRPGFCANGHEITGDNVQMEGERRRCRRCTHERKMRWQKAKRRSIAAGSPAPKGDAP